MHILFAISALCLFALVFTAIAIARHLRASRTSTPPQPDFAQYLFAAAEDQNSRIPQAVPRQTVKEILGKKSQNQPLEFVTTSPDTQAHQSTSLKRF